MKTPESCLSGVFDFGRLRGFELALSEYSERTQHNRTHEREHRTKRQRFKS
jgi:hypothetical protein